MHVSGEYFLEDLLIYAKNIKANAYTIAVLTSLKDQVYIMLEEVNFKNARNPSKVMKELCVPEEKQQLFDFIKDFGKVLGKKTENIHQTLQALEQQDRTRCSFKIFSNLNK